MTNEQTKYEFGGAIYQNSNDFHAAIAETFMCAEGNNPRHVMLELFAKSTDTELADQAIQGWDFSTQDEFSRDALIAALNHIRDNFDVHFPE